MIRVLLMLFAVNVISCGEGVRMVVQPKKLLQYRHHDHHHHNHYKIYKHHMRIAEPLTHIMKIKVEMIQDTQQAKAPEEQTRPTEKALPESKVSNDKEANIEPAIEQPPAEQSPAEVIQPASESVAQNPVQEPVQSRVGDVSQNQAEQISAAPALATSNNQPAKEAANNQPLKADDFFSTFLYFENKSSKVQYFYPKEALKQYQMQGNELELFVALGGGPGIVKMINIVLQELLKHNQVRIQFENQLHLVTKDLVDFIIVLINGDGLNFEQLRYAYNHVSFLQCIDFAEFILLTAKAAKDLNIQQQYASVILERLDYCRVNIVKAK